MRNISHGATACPAVVLLFVAFVVIQLQCFFGGQANISTDERQVAVTTPEGEKFFRYPYYKE